MVFCFDHSGFLVQEKLWMLNFDSNKYTRSSVNYQYVLIIYNRNLFPESSEVKNLLFQCTWATVVYHLKLMYLSFLASVEVNSGWNLQQCKCKPPPVSLLYDLHPKKV